MAIATTSQALSAYAAAGRILQKPSAAPGAGAAQSFGALLKSEIGGAVEDLRKGEAASIAGVTGKASVQQVVEAVTAAELSLQKVTAVRDRVIAAYQEIMRMPL
jgi:flagellar hook-basal body complex protein FliE